MAEDHWNMFGKGNGNRQQTMIAFGTYTTTMQPARLAQLVNALTQVHIH